MTDLDAIRREFALHGMRNLDLVDEEMCRLGAELSTSACFLIVGD